MTAETSTTPVPESRERDPNRIKEYYEQWWESPADIRNVIFRRLNEVVKDQLEHLHPGSAVDLGAGKGAIVRMLSELRFRVTAIEFSERSVANLRARFPDATVVMADLRRWQPDRKYDLATCIEVSQVLTQDELASILSTVRPFAKRLLISISNRKSLHGMWVRIRRFQAPFISTYTPVDLLRILVTAGYRPISSIGIGFLTPISLFKDFRGVIISPRATGVLRALDKFFPRFCHLFLVEAIAVAFEEGAL